MHPNYPLESHLSTPSVSTQVPLAILPMSIATLVPRKENTEKKKSRDGDRKEKRKERKEKKKKKRREQLMEHLLTLLLLFLLCIYFFPYNLSFFYHNVPSQSLFILSLLQKSFSLFIFHLSSYNKAPILLQSHRHTFKLSLFPNSIPRWRR